MWSGGGGKNTHRETAIGVGLIGSISNLLDVADIQILVPDNLSKSYISYCYKSELKNTSKDVLDSVLHHLNLRYTVADSLMNVIQLEVADKDLFNKFAFETVVGRVGHASSSNTYAAVDHVNFSGLKSAIEEKFKK